MAGLADKKIWVHCVANMRVSAFLYQYRRLIGGRAPEEAAKVILPAWKPNEVWQQFMELELERTMV